MRILRLITMLGLLAAPHGCVPSYGFSPQPADASGDAAGDATSSDASDDRAQDTSSSDSAPPGVSLQACVLLLHMEEPSWAGAGAVKDASGRANHGTASGSATTTAAGKFGRAALLDGSGWIAVPGSSPSLQPTDAVTYSAWIYPTGLTDGTPSPGILSKRRGFADNVAFTLFLWTNNQAFADIQASPRFHSNTVFANGQWYHVAVVYDAAQPAARRTSIFVNGALDGAPQPADPSIGPNTEDLLIGNLPGGGNTFVGRIDEVAIWSRALRAEEIKALYESAAPL